MKLIDILIEYNVQWPDGADGVVQDVDSEVKFYAGVYPRVSGGGVWVRDEPVSEIMFGETASDYNTAITTKQEWENRKMPMFADVKVGDKVWDSRKGWGVVVATEHDAHYPIIVDFEDDYDSYTLDGYYSEGDINPALFWDEFEIKSPPAPMPELEVDTEVVVWNKDGHKAHRHFSHFDKDGVLHAFVGGLASFTSKGATTAWDNWELAEYMFDLSEVL